MVARHSQASAAAEVAEEIDGQVFAIEPVEAGPFAPKPAIDHVRMSEDLIIDIPGLRL